jgi:hypothetical protein
MPVVGSVSGASTPAATTTQDWLWETKRHLYTGAKEERNKLAASVTVDASTVSLSYDLGGIQKGTKLSIDLEDMFVWSTASSSATVDRGQFGSTAAAHTQGSIVTVDAKFTDAEIFRALNDELRSLSSRLFQMKTVDLTYDPVSYAYNLTEVTNVRDIYAVYYESISPDDDWPEVRGWELKRNQSVSDFASGYALTVPYADPSSTVRVLYRAPFGYLSGLTDAVVATTGIPQSAIDIPPIGAAIRLTNGREIRRNFNEVQGDTRRAAEVPPGANLGASRNLIGWYERRITEEYYNLLRAYPLKKHAWV